MKVVALPKSGGSLIIDVIGPDVDMATLKRFAVLHLRVKADEADALIVNETGPDAGKGIGAVEVRWVGVFADDGAVRGRTLEFRESTKAGWSNWRGVR